VPWPHLTPRRWCVGARSRRPATRLQYQGLIGLRGEIAALYSEVGRRRRPHHRHARPLADREARGAHEPLQLPMAPTGSRRHTAAPASPDSSRESLAKMAHPHLRPGTRDGASCRAVGKASDRDLLRRAAPPVAAALEEGLQRPRSPLGRQGHEPRRLQPVRARCHQSPHQHDAATDPSPALSSRLPQLCCRCIGRLDSLPSSSRRGRASR